MKTIAISSIFVLFAIMAGATVPSAFADHATATVEMGMGSSVPGCEETNECYIPYEVTVDVGGEVTWVNDDAGHTVTAGDLNEDKDLVGVDYPNGFDSGFFTAGNSFSHKFEVAGDYPYFCQVHPWMVGIVHVQAEEMEDDHGDDHGDGMMHMEGDASAMGMTASGYSVMIWADKPAAGAGLEISLEVKDPNGMTVEHLNHDIKVTQAGAVVLDDKGAHHHEGTGSHTTAPLKTADPVDVEITLQGLGVGELSTRTGPIGEKVVFTKVVPEFGAITMLILSVAIISIIAVTAKSRVIPRL